MKYISSATQIALQARYRLTALIVGALGASTILYVLIGWFFAPSMPPGEYPWLNNISIVITVLVTVLVLIFIRRWLLSPTRLQIASLRSPGSVLNYLYLASIVGAVIGDLIGILGVVASLLTGIREYSWRLGIAALLMILYSFPRRNEWEKIIAKGEAERNKNFSPSTSNASPDSIRLGLTDSE